MPIPYEILIRGTIDGKLSGAHAIDTPGGIPRALTKADLAQVAPDLNAAALARLVDVDAEIAAAKTEADEVKASIAIIETAIDDPAIDDTATLAIAKAEAQKSKLTKRQKELAEIDAQIAALQARKAEVRDAKKTP